MYRVRHQIGCDQVSYTGKDVHVVLLDTGICKHPDLADRIEGIMDFTDHEGSGIDDNGHGIHVAGCLSGDGRASNGKYQGIAPKSRIWSGKILDRDGNGDLSQLVEALEWVVHLNDETPIQVVNISVGASNLQKSLEFQYVTELIRYLSRRKVLFFCAAGNFAANSRTISLLGSLENVITVGCHEGSFGAGRKDLCQFYSCIGNPKAEGNHRKPDVVAPGTDIISCNLHFHARNGRVWNGYCPKSGTSMATPIAAGAAALFKEKYPYASVADYKSALADSCLDVGLPFFRQGYGMLWIPGLLNEK